MQAATILRGKESSTPGGWAKLSAANCHGGGRNVDNLEGGAKSLRNG